MIRKLLHLIWEETLTFLQPLGLLIAAIISVVVMIIAFIISLFIVWLMPERYLITQIAGMCIAFVALMVIPEKDW